jgi:hypothetical protein
MISVLYKVDSGAGYTTISKRRLNTLGYDDTWIKGGRLLEGAERPSVASGLFLEGCYEVVIPEVQIGEWVGYNWPFLTCLSNDVEFRSLFGTDSMQFFNWTFDYERSVWRFSLIQGKRRLVFNSKEQSIHSLSSDGNWIDGKCT